MKRNYIVVLLLLTLATPIAGAHGADGHKNLKILVDDHHAVDDGMKLFNKGLGAKCELCHGKKKDSDEKEQKLSARKFLDRVVAERDTVKRSQALATLLTELKLERAVDEKLIWKAVDGWKKRTAQ